MSSEPIQDDLNPHPWPAWRSQLIESLDPPQKPLGWDDPYLPDPYAQP